MDASLSGSSESLLFSEEELLSEEGTERGPEGTRHKDETPLDAGAPINQWESLTSILSFVQSEHISGAGLGRLLSLINIHLPKPNNVLKTNARLFKVLQKFDEPALIHYFCSVC